MFLTLVCSVAQKHAVLKIKNNEYHSTKLNESPNVDKLYDFKSNFVLNLPFKKLLAPESNIVYVFFNNPCSDHTAAAIVM